MKKLILTIAIILGMGTTTFAQNEFYGSDEVYEEAGLFGKGSRLFPSTDEPLLPDHEDEDDFDANGAPMGSGIAVLVSLGAAYAVARKRREE